MLRALRRCSCCWRSLTAAPAARAAEQVDLLLVLAADVSRSVDQAKFQLQREGYAAAISDKRVLEAITAGRHRRIAVCFVEWSGVSSQQVVIDWTLIDGPDAARKFGDQLARTAALVRRAHLDQRRHRFRHGRAGARAVSRRRAAPSTCRATAPTIPAATSRSPATRRVAQGVTINGLVILSDRPMPWNPEHTNPPGGLANYYRNNVIGGPGAFVIVAEDFNSFGQAIIKKLIAEIAEAPRPLIGKPPRRLTRRAVALCRKRARLPLPKCRRSRFRQRVQAAKPAVSIHSRLRILWNYSNLLIFHAKIT